MFKKRKEKKQIKRLEKERFEAEYQAKIDASRAEQKAFDDFFKEHDICDLYDAMCDKLKFITDASNDVDHTLTNQYTGKAVRISVKFAGVTKPLHKFNGDWAWTEDSETRDYVNKGELLRDTVYKMLIGVYAPRTGSFLYSHNLEEVIWQFMKYEEKFPDSLKLLFKLQGL